MIKTHPTEPMLRAFAADELPLPLAVGVSAHCEFCPECAARVKQIEEALACQHLAPDAPDEMPSERSFGRRPCTFTLAACIRPSGLTNT